MKLATKSLLTVPAAAVLAGSAAAAPIVQQSLVWTDGNNATAATSNSIAFDVVNSDSILVVGIYIDNSPGAAYFSTLDYGGVAPDATSTNDRMVSYLFLNPTTAAASFNFAKKNTVGDTNNDSGLGIIMYEVSGANVSLASITTATASDSIDTTTADELVISFAGNNGTLNPPTVGGSSIFTDEDYNSNPDFGPMRGGGSLSSASATVPSIGSQNTTWTNNGNGRITYAFEAVPEPGSLALLGLGGLCVLRRRRN